MATEKRHRSIFDVPFNFFDSCQLLPSPLSSVAAAVSEPPENLDQTSESHVEVTPNPKGDVVAVPRLTCNTCKSEFESLLDQRLHFKSDIHRLNVKLRISGKDIVKEEDFEDELTSDCLKDYDVSSISGSEDEGQRVSWLLDDVQRRSRNRLFVRLGTGERVSIWKCLFLNDFDSILYENEKSVSSDIPCLRESEVIQKLKFLIHEPRDNTHLRIVLLASGGHFAGCVFDGNTVVAQKTFHRYVVRAKAGKKQSSKDGTGKSANSAGASLRRYNELALKKEIQELLSFWKPYFDASSCIFIHAPSNNRELLYNGENPYFSHQHCIVRNVPFTVRRPTLKEARRIYNQLTQVFHEVDEKEIPQDIKEFTSQLSATTINNGSIGSRNDYLGENLDCSKITEACSGYNKCYEVSMSSEGENDVIGTSTQLHEASQSGDVHNVLELLEQGLDPCVKDKRGRTPYELASEKEVRNTFRRFMAENLDKWDWHAAKVPSALTKEMEESQAAKQAEKDAKRKAKAKAAKKLRKEKEKKAQTEAALSQNAATVVENQGAKLTSVHKQQSLPAGSSQITKEEELKRAQSAEREKRAAAAERRIAATALNVQGNNTTVAPSTSQPKNGIGSDIICTCCGVSLAGKVPFHRYNYKYCSTTCMHVHREMLEDG